MSLNQNLKIISTKYKQVDEYICNMPNIHIMKTIYNNALKKDIPFYVLLGIFIIETTNRNALYRFGECVITLCSGIFSLFFKTKIKNYTIGVCQIGLGNILLINFNQNKRYNKQLIICNVNEYKTIIKAFNKNYNIELASVLIKEFMLDSKELSTYRQIRYIGQKYNGRIEYGILLCKIVQALEKNNIEKNLQEKK